MKTDGRKGNRFLKITSVYLLIIFIVSVIVSYHQQSAKTNNVSEVCEFAQSFLTDPKQVTLGKSFDCSDYTRYVFKKFGYTLPRSSIQQFRQFAVKENMPKPGDLIFFSTDKKKVGHVGIYLKDKSFIHSPGENRGVKIDMLSDNYWKSRYQGSGSVIKSQN